jgi:hypothetical protein
MPEGDANADGNVNIGDEVFWAIIFSGPRRHHRRQNVDRSKIAGGVS